MERRTAGTVDGYRRTIRAALGAAQRRGLIAANPALGRMDALPDPAPDGYPDLGVWEPEQTAAFLEHVSRAASDRLAALYEVATYTGLRRGELCGLRWCDLDENGSGLNVRQTLIEVSRRQIASDARACPVCGIEHVGRVFKGPKSRAGRRWVPLARPAEAALRAHRITQQAERARLGSQCHDHDLVFCAPNGDPLRPSTVSSQFAAHVAACGLPRMRLHDTRHGACSLLLSGGVPIEVVRLILGHSGPGVTHRVYAHIMRGPTARQVEAATQVLTRHRRTIAAELQAKDSPSAAAFDSQQAVSDR